MNPPPPPPPPNPAKLMQMMVESQRLLTETINQMANMGQHLISIVISRISWILSLHLLERLRNPFRQKNG